jgi:hypothetical protein
MNSVDLMWIVWDLLVLRSIHFWLVIGNERLILKKVSKMNGVDLM